MSPFARRQPRWIWSAMVLWLGALAQPAAAALVTFGFAGAVTSVGNEIGGAFQAGQLITGSYTFESSTIDADPSGSGFYDRAVRNLTFTVGAYAGGFNPNAPSLIELTRTGQLHNYLAQVDAFSGAPVRGANQAVYVPSFFTLNLLDPHATALADDQLPQTPPALAGFADRSIFIDFQGSGLPLQTVVARLDALSLVPLPAAGWMFALGLAGLAAMRHRVVGWRCFLPLTGRPVR